MEGEEFGVHCAYQGCKQLDFLPIKCHHCGLEFCKDHAQADKHDCLAFQTTGNRISPLCPICSKPIYVGATEDVNVIMNHHIESGCKYRSDAQMVVRKPCCQFPGCEEDVTSPVVCPHCQRRFCLKHRLPEEHACRGVRSSSHSPSSHSSLSPSRPSQPTSRSSAYTSISSASSKKPASSSSLLTRLLGGSKPKYMSDAVIVSKKKLSAKGNSSLDPERRRYIEVHITPTVSTPLNTTDNASSNSTSSRLSPPPSYPFSSSSSRSSLSPSSSAGLPTFEPRIVCYFFTPETSVGRAVDYISTEEKITNRNNIPGEKKLSLFLKDSSEPIPMDVKMDKLIDTHQKVIPLDMHYC